MDSSPVKWKGDWKKKRKETNMKEDKREGEVGRRGESEREKGRREGKSRRQRVGRKDKWTRKTGRREEG